VLLGAECHNPNQDGKVPAAKVAADCLQGRLTTENQISNRSVNPSKLASIEV